MARSLTVEKASIGVFRRLADRVAEGVLLISEDGELAFANDRSLSRLGVASTEALGARWPEIRRQIGGRLSESMRQRIVLGPGLGGEVAREVYVELSRVEEDDFIGYLAMVRDDPVALEMRPRSDSRDRGLGRFFSQLAHDLRAPLSTMQIRVDLLRELLKNETKATAGEVERQLRSLDHELARLSRRLSQLEASGADRSSMEPFDLPDPSGAGFRGLRGA